VFYLWLLYVAWQTIRDAKQTAPANVRRMFGAVWILFLVSWTIYPLAYLMPQISATADGVVIRNLIYSFADIASKAVYGVMLAVIAQKMSAAAGYGPAIEAEEAFAETSA
jgi:bacteriorhodopsin